MPLRRRLDECGELQGRVGVAVVADGMQGKYERLHPSWAMTSDDPRACARLHASLSDSHSLNSDGCTSSLSSLPSRLLYWHNPWVTCCSTSALNYGLQQRLAVRHSLDTAEPQARHMHWAHWPRYSHTAYRVSEYSIMLSWISRASLSHVVSTSLAAGPLCICRGSRPSHATSLDRLVHTRQDGLSHA